MNITDHNSAIFNEPDKVAKLFPDPVLQCLQVKQMAPSVQGADRFRLVVSDCDNYVQSVLAPEASHLVHDGKIQRGCFLRMKEYMPNNFKGKK